jgi:hypothetical protein
MAATTESCSLISTFQSDHLVALVILEAKGDKSPDTNQDLLVILVIFTGPEKTWKTQKT